MIFTYFVKSYFHLTKVLKSKPRRMQYLNPYPNRDINTHVIEKYTGEIFKDLALARRTVFLQIATVYNTLVLEKKKFFRFTTEKVSGGRSFLASRVTKPYIFCYIQILIKSQPHTALIKNKKQFFHSDMTFHLYSPFSKETVFKTAILYVIVVRGLESRLTLIKFLNNSL